MTAWPPPTAGLDLEMPSPKFMNRENLIPAIQSGKVTMATLDDKVRRILRTAIRFGWLDRDQTDPPGRFTLTGAEGGAGIRRVQHGAFKE